ncbi:hypothetical protein DFQ28_000774 [Apophysomyces sp. BC1034]|nr:hypothetical protein DFQ28_000774 [Apophysomyces sp. BC1034]
MQIITALSLAAVAGMALAAPASDCKTTYVVKSGDSCWEIGNTFHISFDQLKKWNPSINDGCTNLSIGQTLCVSGPNGTPTPTGKPECTTNDDCPGVTCCNLFTNKCVNDPNDTICDIKPTSTSLKPSTTGKPKPTSKPECTSNDDCPGEKCCNLFTNKCVNDPNGTICDIKPTITSLKPSTTGKPKPTSKPECTSNDDCPGEKCCNLFTNKCVNDPKGNICDIKPPSH